MGTVNVTCYKGVNEGDWLTLALDPDMKLSDVRTLLTRERFLPPGSDAEDYRFVGTGSTTPQELEKTKGLILENLEPYLPVRSILGHGLQMILTDIKANPKSDLVGMATEWFFDRHLGVQISLNDADPAAKEINQRIRAFKPMQLTHVKPTSDAVAGLYDNVCVCVENSTVQFNIHSWGAAGFNYDIRPQSGDPIAAGLYVTFGDDRNRYSATSLRRYETSAQTIQIVGAEAAQIPTWETLRFQKVTVKSRRITSYKKNGKTYSSNAMPPVNASSRSVYRDSIAEYARARDIVGAGDIGILPGDAIKPGGPTTGPASQQQFGGVSDVETDDWTQALGSVVIFFFVFRSWEDANRVINGYNAPDPNLWR